MHSDRRERLDAYENRCYYRCAESYGVGGILFSGVPSNSQPSDCGLKRPPSGGFVPAVRFSTDGLPEGGRFAMPMPRLLHRWIDEQEVKRCPACQQWLPLNMFTREARKWDSLAGTCKECLRKRFIPHREARRERSREWGRANPEKILEACRRYREANPEKVRKAQRRSYGAKREERIEYALRWAKKNPDKRLAKDQRRRARKRAADGADYTTSEHIAGRIEAWGFCCYLCGAAKEAVDHVIPLAEGGSHWPANLRPVCKSCNSKKGAIWPYDIERHRRDAGYYAR